MVGGCRYEEACNTTDSLNKNLNKQQKINPMKLEI